MSTGRHIMPVIAISLITVVSAVVGLNLALPDIARRTGASQAELTWIVDAYTVVFAALLFFAGALGDRFGRKPLLAIGLAVFGLAALVGTTVSEPWQLIAVRAVMGLAASAVMPTTLSVITTSFPERERPAAIGAWVGMAGAGAILGLLVTAVLLQYFEWPAIFWLNVGLAAAALIGTLARVPDSTEANPAPIDLGGGVLALLGFGGLVFGIIEGPVRGWGDPWTVSSLAAGVLGLGAFVWWELGRAHPLLDPRLFRDRRFGSGALALTTTFFVWFGVIFMVVQYLQFVVGYSPLMTAACLLPIPFFLLPTARTAPKVAARLGYRRVVPIGMLLLSAGLVVLSRLQVELTYWVFAVGLGLTAAGMGISGTPSTTALTEALPEAKQGVASASNDTARELGSALGIAVLGSTLNQVYRDGLSGLLGGLPSQAVERILGSVAFTQAPELSLLGPRGAALAQAGRQAFVDGVSRAFLVAAAVAVIAALVVWLTAPRSPQGSPPPGMTAGAEPLAGRGRATT